MFDLDGKCALVTGASGGIGMCIARRLHAAGAKVALSGTRRNVLEELAQSLGERSHVVVADISSQEETERVIKEASEVMGGLHILVNNAGLTRDTLAMRMKPEDWQTVLDINLTAAFNLSKNAIRAMMKSRWGRIINITSLVGVTGNVGQSNYAASKAGLIGMSKSLACEVSGRGITVNCIAPGLIETPMLDKLEEDYKKKLIEKIPVGRIGQADDIAYAVVYLASEEAAYVTGQTLHVNGGMVMV